MRDGRCYFKLKPIFHIFPQLGISIDIRKKLNLKDGDKLIFIEDGDKIIFANAAKVAFMNIQKAFEGEAERLG